VGTGAAESTEGVGSGGATAEGSCRSPTAVSPRADGSADAVGIEVCGAEEGGGPAGAEAEAADGKVDDGNAGATILERRADARAASSLR